MLRIIVPLYKGNKHLSRNLDNWKKLIENFDCTFIEDNHPGESRKIIKDIGGKYISKKNGQWGSVYNYYLNNFKINDDDFIAIFDQDDSFDIEEIIALSKKVAINIDVDVFITNLIKKNIRTKKTFKDTSVTMMRNPHIHSMIWRHRISKKVGLLKENTGYSDNELIAKIFNLNPKVECLDQSPYIYMIGDNEQSTSKTNLKSKWFIKSSISIVEEISKLNPTSINPVTARILTWFCMQVIYNTHNTPSKFTNLYKEHYKSSSIKMDSPWILRIKSIFVKNKYDYKNLLKED